MKEFRITTTGTANPVILSSVGYRQIPHPTSDYDLATEFDIEELLDPTGSVILAITAGELTAEDEQSTSITAADAQTGTHTHRNENELDLLTDGDHDVRSDNPHGTTKTHVGLSNVPNLNTTPAVNNEHTHSNKSELDQVTDGDHNTRTDNPHSITPAQISAATTSHNHIESDITDLDHNATSIQGTDVHTTTPTDGQVLVYNLSNTRFEATTPSGASHNRLHNLDATADHTGITGTTDNFMSLDASGLPQDSTYAASDFKQKPSHILYVGPNQDHTTIASAISAATVLSPSSSQYVQISIAPYEYTESIIIPDYVIMTGTKEGTQITGTITYTGSNDAHIEYIRLEGSNNPAISKTGSGTLYLDNMSLISEWTDTTAIQSTVSISNGTIELNTCVVFLEQTNSTQAGSLDTTCYSISGTSQSSIKARNTRNSINCDSGTFTVSIGLITNTASGTRLNLINCENIVTSNHPSNPQNLSSIVIHSTCIAYSYIFNNRSFAYAPNTTGNALFIAGRMTLSSTNWNTMSFNNCFFQWADIADAQVYGGSVPISYDAVLHLNCFFGTGTDIFPAEYTIDGSAGSYLTTIMNTYGSVYAGGSGGNVAITDLAQTITGGWTFATASPTFAMSPIFNNDIIWLGKNTGGTAESVMWPRASDNNTYINYGSGGNFYLRNNSSVIQYGFSDTSFDVNNSSIDNIDLINLSSNTSDPSTSDGDIWYRSDTRNFRAQTDSRTHVIQLVQIVQVANSTATEINSTTTTAIPWDSTTASIRMVDDIFTHSTSSNSSRVYIDENCLCEITYNIYGDNVGNSRTTPQMYIRLNGGSTNFGYSTGYTRNTTDDKISCSLPSMFYTFTSGDYIEVYSVAGGSTGSCLTIPQYSVLNIKLLRYT